MCDSCLLTCITQSFSLPASAPAEICTLSLHDALPISCPVQCGGKGSPQSSATTRPSRIRGSGPIVSQRAFDRTSPARRSEEHTSELQSLRHLVCRLLLEKKKMQQSRHRYEEALEQWDL